MDSLLKKLLRGDATIWVVYAVLCVISILFMYSASSTLAYKAADYYAPIMQHMGYLVLGVLAAFVVHLIPYSILRPLAYVGLAASVVLLLMLQLGWGVEENEATRWMSILGFRFQPSEIAKLSLILAVGDMMARIKDGDAESERFWFRCILGSSVVVCGLILIDNFSTGAILFVVVFAMMLIGRISWRRLAPIVLAGLLLVGCVYALGKFAPNLCDQVPVLDRFPTWTARIDRFVGGEEEVDKFTINDKNLQEKRSLIAIAGSGFIGRGLGNSVQRDYLPQAYSDFIYAIIIEEGGLLAGIIVIMLYMVLLYRAGKIVLKCDTVYPAMLVIGLSLMIVMQAFVNMGVAVGLGPVTGQPLPLISRGGTSIVITSVYFGIILGVTKQIKEGRRPETPPPPDDVPVVELDEL